ncbi:DUF302 domain-containing protein [Haloplanus rubicundus]|uniref:DUF302 domain-containing protein n=1 Tax=Haloplanus rubicundus TaxID=1547898 RepID=A0A345EFN0_9EURY|nr:DUF302 domain-containing protein [Haloplanus rubicundus]AXG11002.1 DUF302 domain-containing protein [Haloplanus rubicundus]
MPYTMDVHSDDSFADTVDSTIVALEAEGFGVLCDIDVRATFEEKLGEQFRRYRILGACNPELAHEGLSEEPTLGALLPCNVIVYETDEGDVAVSAVDPERLLDVASNPALDAIASDVRERFERVLAAVEGRD